MMFTKYDFYQIVIVGFLLVGCTSSKKLSNSPTDLQLLLADSAIANAHLGLMVSEAETGKVLAEHQPHQYFVPASNTKLWTMYAGIKYLGPQLLSGELMQENDSTIVFRSNADPTVLHPDYPLQPLAQSLARYRHIKWGNANMRTTPYGNGWSWNDYDATYMAPRSSMPLFGNVAEFSMVGNTVRVANSIANAFVTNPNYRVDGKGFDVQRKFDDPMFTISNGNQKRLELGMYLTAEANAKLAAQQFGNTWHVDAGVTNASNTASRNNWQQIYSQPTDSMLKPLMHRSDNFFAEQTLLMISHQWFGYMDEDAVIDSLLKTDLKGLPDKPRWVDGSGLSRYNLFTPADYVWLLQKMKTEFPMDRLQNILPTGNDGTLTNYYKTLQGKIFAKTGTLSGVVGLSGYLFAKSGKLLLFSTLVNNHNGSAPAVRRAIEKYLLAMHEKY